MRKIMRGFFLAVLGLSILTGAALTGRAQAGGRLLFQVMRDKVWDIFTLNSDGFGLLRLTESAGNNMEANWSPDGGKIVFASDRGGDYEIYVMNAGGGGLTRLTENPGRDGYPAWSPDGGKIIYVSERDKRTGVFVMNADGTGQARLTEEKEKAYYPVWSPDGSRIAFIGGRWLPILGATWLVVMDADGGNQKKLDKARGIPSWSPDGNRIVYIDYYSDIPLEGSAAADSHAARVSRYNNKVLITNADGRGFPKTFSRNLEQNCVSWSPDGGRICYVSDTVICIKPVEGRGKTVQIGSQALVRFGVLGLLDKDALIQYLYPSWSPDGSRITYVKYWAEGIFKKYQVSICVTNADGTGEQQLFTETAAMRNPIWAPR